MHSNVLSWLAWYTPPQDRAAEVVRIAVPSDGVLL
jgi:hypothetical protein